MTLPPDEIVVDQKGRVVGFCEFMDLNCHVSLAMTIRQVPGEDGRRWRIQHYDEEHGGGPRYEGKTLKEAVGKGGSDRRLLRLFKLRNPTPATAAWALGRPARFLKVVSSS